MKKTLIKANNSLILVSDGEIKKGDLPYDTYANRNTTWSRTVTDSDLQNSNLKSCVKVLSQSPKISKEVADEIGWIDVEELALNEKIELNVSAWLYNQLSETPDEDLKFCSEVAKDYWISGFQKSEELNQKKYSEEEVRTLITDAVVYFSHTEQYAGGVPQYISDQLKLKNQWQVEAEEIDGVWNVTKILK